MRLEPSLDPLKVPLTSASNASPDEIGCTSRIFSKIKMIVLRSVVYARKQAAYFQHFPLISQRFWTSSASQRRFILSQCFSKKKFCQRKVIIDSLFCQAKKCSNFILRRYNFMKSFFKIKLAHHINFYLTRMNLNPNKIHQ